jgi:iron complex outermembrane receptor protein
MNRYINKVAAAVLAVTAGSAGVTAFASSSVIEEVIVTARKQAETLQDVPVTVSALTEADLDRYNITNLADAGKMVPNMVIAQGGSGNGSNLRLRGVGSSSISAAFDQSVAINLDGVVVNRGRFIHNSYLDMRQLEILKGPQSLYFGKSATAGVISITTNDPGDDFEFEFSAGVETEHDGVATEMVISGPLTDTLGARFAIGYLDNDELVENNTIGVNPNAAAFGADDWFGDESLNARLTMVWEPTDNFSAKLKYSYSEYDSSGGIMWSETLCPDGAPQPSGVPNAASPFAVFQATDDCKLNGNNNRVYLNPGLRNGLPNGFDDGQARLEQETDFLSLQAVWDVTDTLTLTSVTGYVDLDHWELDDYGGGASVFGGLHNNQYESLSQEFRLASAYDGNLNFQAGVYWQETEQLFHAFQYAFNLGVMPNIFGAAYASVGGDPNATIIGPDPITGNEYDYDKKHFTDTEVLSAFISFNWAITDRAELTFGARYTEEDKDGKIEIPYLHAAAGLFGFGGPPVIDGLKFDDTNVSPELAIHYDLTDDISVFAAYKEGFKSGGIDNSALPTAALNPLSPTFAGFDFLIFDSEESEGGEIGMKAHLLDSSIRLNASIFSYEYSNLQVQLFDSTIIQFSTFNASALETEGLEFDLLWQTDIDGLSVRSAMAFTSTEYTGDFFNAGGENLKGEELRNNAKVAGFVGTTYDFAISDELRMSASLDARYSDGYTLTDTLNPYTQDNFWIWDASFSLYTSDDRHEISVIGRNLGDEIYAVSGQSIPGRIAADTSSANNLDQGINTQLGRTVMVRYSFRL